MKHWILASAALAITPATAQTAPASPPTPAAPAPPGYTLPDTQVWDFPAEDGQSYRIFVSLPKGAPPPGGFPVLYVLDGNAMFAGFAEARRIQDSGPGAPLAPPSPGRAIIVGVGYPTDQPYDSPRRLNDFTPPWPGGKAPPEVAMLAMAKVGGQDRFAAFLIDRLRPEIARRYPVNAARQTLFGHSLGGLFALHILYTRPTAFRAIIAASPSNWWNQQGNLGEERAFAAKLAQGGSTGPVSSLLLLAGAQEEWIANRWDTEALAERLKPLSAHGLRVRSEIYADEGHLSVPHRAITQALRFAAVWP